MTKLFVPESIRVHDADPVRQFAEILKWEFNRVGVNVARVARVVGCPQSLVDDWLTGTEIPDGLRWKKIIGIVSRNLQNYSPLRLAALTEHTKRQHNRNAGGEEKMNPLGAKLARVIPLITPAPSKAPEPPPQSSVDEMLRMAWANSDEAQAMPRYEEPEQPDEPPPDAPEPSTTNTTTEDAVEDNTHDEQEEYEDMSQTKRKEKSRQRAASRFPVIPGSRSAEAVQERLAWAREQWMRNPLLPIQNFRGEGEAVIPMMRAKFGTGGDVATLGEVKKKALAELEKLGTPNGIPADQDVPPPGGKLETRKARKGESNWSKDRPGMGYSNGKPTSPPSVRTGDGGIDTETLQSAGLLILEAIPNLAQYTIRVTDSGEVEVSYSIRQVIESSGSLSFARPAVKR